MIFKEAMRSLRNSRSKAIFFALTFYITTTLLFVYFNMAAALTGGQPEVYITSANQADLFQLLEKGNAGNLMMVFVVVMCFIDLLFCNDFFVKNKAKELAVRMICGATYIHMALYLLIQTVLLMVISIPLGILTGYGLIGLMNHLLAMQGETFVITVSTYAMVEFIAVLVFVVFWTILLNCSFAYKSGAVLLAGGNMGAMKDNRGAYGMGSKPAVQILLNIAATVAAILQLYNFFNGSGALAISMIIGSVGLNHVMGSLFLPLLTRQNRKEGTKKTIGLISNGFLRRDMQFCKVTVFLLICDLLVVMTMLFSREYSTLEYLLVIVTYVSIAILQSLTIMFRLETDLSGRMQDYHILSQVGVSEDEKKKIMHSEVTKFYLLILVIVIIYAGTAFLSLYRSGQASTSQILLLSAAAILPLLVTDILTRIYYGQVIKEPLRD